MKESILCHMAMVVLCISEGTTAELRDSNTDVPENTGWQDMVSDDTLRRAKLEEEWLSVTEEWYGGMRSCSKCT
jgi:hypothetical protein